MKDREDIKVIGYLKQNYGLKESNIVDKVDDVDFDSGEFFYITSSYRLDIRHDIKIDFNKDDYIIKFHLQTHDNKELHYLEYLVNKISSPCAILFKNAYCSTETSYIQSMRKLLFMLGYIEEVVRFKGNNNRLLDRYCLFVLNPHGDKNVKLTYEKSDGFISKNYSLEDMKKNAYCFNPVKAEMISMSSNSKMVFGDIAKVKNGCNLNRLKASVTFDGNSDNHDKNVVYPINKSNIGLTYIKRNLESVHINEDFSIDEYRINPATDLIMSVRGGFPKAAMVDEDETRPLVATNNLVIITPKKGYDKEMLLLYLISKQFKSYVMAICADSPLFTLRINDLYQAPVSDIFNDAMINKFMDLRKDYVEARRTAEVLGPVLNDLI